MASREQPGLARRILRAQSQPHRGRRRVPGNDESWRGPPRDAIAKFLAGHLQSAEVGRDRGSEGIIQAAVVPDPPLPPPHFAGLGISYPYEPALPPSRREFATQHSAHIAHACWLATGLHTLAAATAALGQATSTIYPDTTMHQAQLRNPWNQQVVVEEGTSSTAQAHTHAPDQAGDPDPTEGHAQHIAAAASHLRQAARYVQHLAGALGGHLPVYELCHHPSHAYRHAEHDPSQEVAAEAEAERVHRPFHQPRVPLRYEGTSPEDQADGAEEEC